MPWLVYAHDSTLYRRRFCIRYLPDLWSPSEAGKLRGGVKNPKGIGYKTFSYLKSSSIFFNASFWPFFFGGHFFVLFSFMFVSILFIKSRSLSVRLSDATVSRFNSSTKPA